MIFGQTFYEKKRIRQEFFQKLKTNGIKRFAWLPVELYNGQKVWFEHYYIFYRVFENEQKELWIDEDRPRKYLTEKEGQDALH